jgi:hypothetical protein
MNGSSLQATIGNGTAYTSLLFCGSGLSNCTGSTAIALTAPWTLWIWDTVNYPGQPVLTLSPNGDRTVAAIFGSGLAIDVDEDYTTTSGDDANGGTKLTQSNYTFNTAVLMNPVTGAPPNPQSNCNGLSNCTVYTCAASSGCALEIKHQ